MSCADAEKEDVINKQTDPLNFVLLIGDTNTGIFHRLCSYKVEADKDIVR